MKTLLLQAVVAAIHSKSELKVALVAMFVASVAPKLGVPPESLSTFVSGILTFAGVYVAGRSYAKPKEMATDVEAMKVQTQPEANLAASNLSSDR